MVLWSFGKKKKPTKIYVRYTDFRNFEAFDNFCSRNSVIGDTNELWAKLEAYLEITLHCN